MKFIAAIFSIYILLLTGVPCADEHFADADSTCVELPAQDDSHSDNADLCSPFCFCACCQILSFPEIHDYRHISTLSFDLMPAYIEQNYFTLTSSFWRPPKAG